MVLIEASAVSDWTFCVSPTGMPSRSKWVAERCFQTRR